jgi:post-segregation antitoxin (ccd killing protein)
MRRQPVLVTVTVSDQLVREAQDRGLTVQEFVETLIDEGLAARKCCSPLNTAIERIRALSSSTAPGGR